MELERARRSDNCKIILRVKEVFDQFWSATSDPTSSLLLLALHREMDAGRLDHLIQSQRHSIDGPELMRHWLRIVSELNSCLLAEGPTPKKLWVKFMSEVLNAQLLSYRSPIDVANYILR
jgi:hypothetical protein